MKPSLTFLKKPLVILAVALVAFFSLVGKKLHYYAAEPQGDKDCPPLFPELSGQTTNDGAGNLNYLAADLPWKDKGGTINDASCLNRTYVHGTLAIESEADIRDALQYAEENDLKVSIAGVRHSMGGQAFYQNALVLNMMKFNQIHLDAENQRVRVQSGATWHDIQNVLHPRFAVKAMQSTDIFTVGGSISVNAHGMDHHAGALANSIHAMTVMLPDGTVTEVSREINPELFRLVVGGYGLFGIILEAELNIVPNVLYESRRRVIDYQEFPEVFANEIAEDEEIGLFYAHLSTAPQSLLREMIFYTYHQIDAPEADIPPLGEVSSVGLRRMVLNFSKQGNLAMRLKWFAEKHIEPMLESCTISRNQALGEGEGCLVSRNEPMHDSVPYLYNRLKNDTDILHEYFIPRENFLPFVDELRDILIEDKVNLLNASVRIVHAEDIVLNYSPTDSFSLVLYINQNTDEAGNEKMQETTRKLIDLTNRHSGRFFLPYQLHFTAEQLATSYPEIGTFFAAKRQIDPEERLTNTLYEKYAPHFRTQAQTTVTLPPEE